VLEHAAVRAREEVREVLALVGADARDVGVEPRLPAAIARAAGELGVDDDGVPFDVKKEVTSALRRLAPIGLSTDIVWTANVRTLRHVIEMRTASAAEEELRLVFDRVAEIAVAEAPGLFQDFRRDGDGSWVPEHRKV
jgi:thymidylate synthase (FAD)